MSLSCEDCDRELVAFAYHELSRERVPEVSDHLERCTSCRETAMRLERARERVRSLPRPAVDIPAIPTRQVTAVPAPELVVDAPRDAPRRPWAFLLHPQLPMFLLLTLMVGIALWYVPGRGTPPDATLDSTDGVGARSLDLEPAAPLDLDVDPATGRLLAPSSPPPRRDRTQEARHQLIDALEARIDERDCTAARTLFQTIVDRFPESVEANRARARIGVCDERR